MLQVGELEELGRDVGDPVPIETENLECCGQVPEAAQLKHRYPVVVQDPGNSFRSQRHFILLKKAS